MLPRSHVPNPQYPNVADNALLLEVIAGPDGVDTRQQHARVGAYVEAAGQAPKEDIRARVKSEELRAKDLKMLRALEGLEHGETGYPHVKVSRRTARAAIYENI